MNVRRELRAAANKLLHPTAAALRFFGTLPLTSGRRG
jgi:hypothetical protein